MIKRQWVTEDGKCFDTESEAKIWDQQSKIRNVLGFILHHNNLEEAIEKIVQHPEICITYIPAPRCQEPNHE